MKKMITKFYHSNEKKNNKLLKKMFGIKNLADAIIAEEKIRTDLEKSLGKEIDLIEFSELNGRNYLMYNYIKYKTLRTIIDLIMDNRKVYAITQDYIEVSKND